MHKLRVYYNISIHKDGQESNIRFLKFITSNNNYFDHFKESRIKEIKVKTPKQIDCKQCKFLCSLNFPEELRSEICRSFWQLGDYRRQKDFILSNVVSSSPKRRRPSREPTVKSKLRTNSKSFYLLSKRVCQSFFLKTLAISNGPLIKAFEHKNVYTNFFDGDDKRGRHTPSNKLSNEIVESVLQHLELYILRSKKSKKQIINDPDIRSLRQLYNIYKEAHDSQEGGLSLSYTSFKRIFNEHNFSFPPDRVRCKPLAKHKTEFKSEESEDTSAMYDVTREEEYIDEHIIEEDVNMPNTSNNLSQPKVIVTQVPDSSKFFANPSQVYEIQFIEIPINPT